MIPPYGHRHRPVTAAPLRLAFAPPARGWWRRLRGPRPHRDGVVVDGEAAVLRIRFRRLRVVTPLTNIAAAQVEPTCPETDGLVLGAGTTPVVHIRFHRPVPGAGRVARLGVEAPDELVRHLGSGPA